MLDLTKIPHSLLSDLRERGYTDAQIKRMTPQRAFDEYCEWQGLVVWGSSLRAAMESLEEAEVDEPTP